MINFAQILTTLKTSHHYRTPKILQSAQGINIRLNNQNIVNFSSNDYLSLANDKRLKQATIKGIEQYGVSSGSSQMVSGYFDIYHELEQALSNYCQTESSLIFSSGYLANLGVFSALKDDIAWVLQDKLNHASLIDGNQLANLPIRRYGHNNLESLTKKLNKLKTQFPHKTGLIASDIIFSMDGNSANIPKLRRTTSKFGDLLLLDGAHHFGMEAIPTISKNILYMGTFGKAIGTMGAFITGDIDMIDVIRQKARSHIYTTALPPAIIATTLMSLDIIKAGKQQQKLKNNIAFFQQIAKHHQLNFMPSNSAIQPLIIGNNSQVIALQNQLEIAGFLVGAIRHPTVKKGTERLRISLNANHTQNQIEQLLSLLKTNVEKINYLGY